MAHETDEEFLDGISPCTRIVDYGEPLDAACTPRRQRGRALDPGAIPRTRRPARHAPRGTGSDARDEPPT